MLTHELELDQLHNLIQNTFYLLLFFQSMAALLQPFGNCAEYLNPKVMQVVFAPGMEKAVRYVQELEENDLKEKVNKQC